jgi:hypothetical protein
MSEKARTAAKLKIKSCLNVAFPQLPEAMCGGHTMVNELIVSLK